MPPRSGKQLKLTNRDHALSRNHAEVVARLAIGETQPSIAESFGVNRTSVLQFARKHAEEIAEKKKRVDLAIEDYTISKKVKRIAALQLRWEKAQALIEARANDDRFEEPGYETGLMIHNLKGVGSGNAAEIVDEYKTDIALMAEMRAIERAAAEELGQIAPAPKVEFSTTNILTIGENSIDLSDRSQTLALAEGLLQLKEKERDE